MASSSFTGSTNSSYITPRILWSSTPNSDTNKSDITVTFQLCKSSSSTSSTYGTGSWVLNINNVPYSFSVKVTLPANNTYVTVYTKTVTGIDHNTDGTKSVPISVTGGISGTTYTTTSINGNAILDTILRASSLSVPTSVNTGSNLTTTITPVNTAFRHKVQYIIDGTAKYTSDYIAAGTTTFSYTIPHSWLPSSTSKSMTVRLYTYTSSGTSAIGQKDVATTVNVPDTIKPSISSFVATVGSGGLSGLYVQGKSTVKLTCTATMGADATVSSYVFSGPGVNTSSTTNTTTSSVLTSSGTLTYKVKVTDSRGRYAEATVSIVVYPYTSPKIVSITAQRCDTSGTLKTDGTCTKVTVVTSHSSVNGKNTGNVVLFNSKDITSNKPTETTVISSTTDSNTYTGVYGSGFKIDTVYTISAKITDSYTSHTSSVPLGAAQRAFNIAKYGNGVAIGGLSTVTSKTAEGLFECNWDAKFIGDVDVTGSFRPATPLAIANGGTGATTAALARNALGLGNTTGALPIANGGTGSTTQKGARDNIGLGYLSNNILDISQCLLENCTYSNGVITSAINSKYYLSLNTTALNDLVMNNKGNKLTLSIASGVANRGINIVIYGVFSDGSTYAQAVSADGARTTTLTIPTTLTRADSVSIQLNRLATAAFTDTSTKFTNLQLELGASATTYNPPLQPLVATSSYSVLFTFGGTEFGMRLTKYGKVVVCNVYRNTISTAQTLSNAYVLVAIPSEFKPAPNVLMPTESPQSPLVLRGDYSASVIGSMFLVDASYVKMFANSPITLSAGVVVAGQLTWITV